MRKILSILLTVCQLFCSCNKKEIEDLQSRLDQLEKTTIVSINAQIQSVKSSILSMEGTQKQLEDYIKALEAKGAALEDIVESLKQKDAQLASDLQALQKLVNQNADDVRQWMEQATATLSRFETLETEIKGIQSFLDTVNTRLAGLEENTKKLTDAIKKNQDEIQGIKQSLQALQEDMDQIKSQIEALMSSVQSVVVVPDFADGSVEISNKAVNTLRFEVHPLSAAELLAKLGASAVSLDAVETRAGGAGLNFPISATTHDGKYFIVTADGSGLPKTAKTGDLSLHARLLISDGVVTRSSEYFPLSVKWDPTLDKYTYTAQPVDLGLSVKWSAFNLGADTPEGYGAIFAWGETETKQDFNRSTYKWCEEDGKYTRYCANDQYGTVDGLSVLEPDDDAAHVKLGGDWRMPTKEEMVELLQECRWTWTTDYNGTGISGCIVSSLVEGFEEQSIFLPAAGYSGQVGPQFAGTNGSYWSASFMDPANPNSIYCLVFDHLGPNEGGGYRFHGRSIRPVIE